jgi:hypothetical protein
MIASLKKVIAKAEKLPAKEQKMIAQLIEDELSWDETIGGTKGQLTKLAEEALEEYKKGKTKPLDI